MDVNTPFICQNLAPAAVAVGINSEILRISTMDLRNAAMDLRNAAMDLRNAAMDLRNSPAGQYKV